MKSKLIGVEVICKKHSEQIGVIKAYDENYGGIVIKYPNDEEYETHISNCKAIIKEPSHV